MPDNLPLTDLNIFKKAFENSPNSMVLVKYENNLAQIIDVNKSYTDFYGFTKEEVLGGNPKTIKSGKQDSTYYSSMWTNILDPKIGYWRDEIVNKRKDGSLINVILTIYSIFDDLGKAKFFIANHIDITKRVTAEKQVLDLNEILKLLNKILRHDILNDLTVIKGNIKLFESGIDKEGIRDTLPAVERSMGLINQMRELEGAVSSGKQLETVNIKEIIKEVLGLFPEMDISLSGEALVRGDAALKSVISNIIRNAKMHGLTQKMDITISNLNESFVEIKLADYGRGIPDEIKGKLFTEGFFYGDTGHSGLGLYIVRKTIERYGGSVGIDNNVPNGAIFILRIPLPSSKAIAEKVINAR
jgi:PAS domain S-box-containing protein